MTLCFLLLYSYKVKIRRSHNTVNTMDDSSAVIILVTDVTNNFHSRKSTVIGIVTTGASACSDRLS
jgi:hypothetical protein